MTEASVADFTNLLNDSCKMRLDAGGIEVTPNCLAILLKQLFSFEDYVLQPETAAGSVLWLVASPYYLNCPQKLIHQQATSLRTLGGIAFNQS